MNLKKIIIAPITINFPRLLSLKFSELLFVLFIFQLTFSKKAIQETLKIQWLFLVGAFIAVIVAYFKLGAIDSGITDTKSIFYSPEISPLFIFFRVIFAFFLTSWFATLFFRNTSNEKKKLIGFVYIIDIIPGLLQVFRILTNLYFDIPYFEKAGFGPFSGVFDAGYLRIMGFDFEPLGYAFTLTISSILYYNYCRKLPIVGIILLIMTFGSASIAGTILSLVIVYLVPFISRNTKFILVLIITMTGIYLMHVYSDIIMLISFTSRSLSDRFITTMSSLYMFIDNPFGVGLGNWSYFFNTYNPSQLLFPKIVTGDIQANNDLMQFLATGGFLLCGGYIWIFIALVKRSKRKIFSLICMVWFFAALAGYIFFNPLICLIQGIVVGEFLYEKEKL